MRIKLSLASLAFISFTSITAEAKTCELSLEGSDTMQFSTKELTVEKDCTEVKVTLKHSGKLPKSAMGHNWVLTKEADAAGVIADAVKAGVAADYIPKDDKRIIASTKLVGGGESASTSFKSDAVKAGEKYKFFCTFPGHSGVMSGVLTVK